MTGICQAIDAWHRSPRPSSKASSSGRRPSDERRDRTRPAREGNDVKAFRELWDRVAPDPVDILEDALAAEVRLEDALGKLHQEKAVL